MKSIDFISVDLFQTFIIWMKNESKVLAGIDFWATSHV